jgi:hypothetical protein
MGRRITNDDDFTSYERTNQSSLAGISPFNSYEPTSTASGKLTTPVPDTCCLCGTLLDAGRTLLCPACQEQERQRSRAIFGKSPEDAA